MPVDVGPQHVVRELLGELAGPRRGRPGRARRSRRTPPAIRRAGGRWPGPAPGPGRRGHCVRGRLRRCRRPARPRSSRTRWRCRRRAAGRWPRTRPGRRRRWPARPGRSPGRPAGRSLRTCGVAPGRPSRRTRRRARRPRPRPARPPAAGRGVRADAVQQSVADLAAVGAVDADQRPVDEPAHRVQRRRRRHAQRRQHVLDRIQGGAAGEAGQCPQPALVVGEEQVVAPADRPLQRAAPLGTVAARVAQQGEPVLQAASDVVHRQRPHPGGGELDGQRQSVEGTAHVLHDRGGRRVEHERTPQLLRTTDEQGDRLFLGQRLELVHGALPRVLARPGWSRARAGRAPRRAVPAPAGLTGRRRVRSCPGAAPSRPRTAAHATSARRPRRGGSRSHDLAGSRGRRRRPAGPATPRRAGPVGGPPRGPAGSCRRRRDRPRSRADAVPGGRHSARSSARPMRPPGPAARFPAEPGPARPRGSSSELCRNTC